MKTIKLYLSKMIFELLLWFDGIINKVFKKC